jgi:hypothetical protein
MTLTARPIQDVPPEPTPRPELCIKVRPDATVCLDLVLRDAGVDYRELGLEPDGASVVIDLHDLADLDRIVAVLRQHLGVMLRCALVDHDARHECLIHGSAPTAPSASSGDATPGGISDACGNGRLRARRALRSP